MNTTLVIPDTHIPYHKPGFLDFAYDMYHAYNCNQVISVGDMYDCYNFSVYDKDSESDSLPVELRKSRQVTALLHKMWPNMIVLEGNHENRITRKLASAGFSSKLIPTRYIMKQCFNFPDSWEYKYQHIQNSILFIHGDFSGCTGTAGSSLRHTHMSTVHGHIHSKASIVHQQTPYGLLTEMSCGTGADSNSFAFKYARKTMKKHVYFVGIIEDNGAQFNLIRYRGK